uniref:Uncharacterized protein n=1 Tax=Anguilla anguilla TaxID=7936 RepID=A0A0E9X4J3_ANGAN
MSNVLIETETILTRPSLWLNQSGPFFKMVRLRTEGVRCKIGSECEMLYVNVHYILKRCVDCSRIEENHVQQHIWLNNDLKILYYYYNY